MFLGIRMSLVTTYLYSFRLYTFFIVRVKTKVEVKPDFPETCLVILKREQFRTTDPGFEVMTS